MFLSFFDLVLALAVVSLYLCDGSSSRFSPAQIFPLNPELYIELPAPSQLMLRHLQFSVSLSRVYLVYDLVKAPNVIVILLLKILQLTSPCSGNKTKNFNPHLSHQAF